MHLCLALGRLAASTGLLLAFLLVTVPGGALANSLLGFPTVESSNYLIIGMGPVNDAPPPDPPEPPAVGVGMASNTSNFELGANKAPVPSTGDFLDNGGSGGPTLLGAVPDLPSGIEPVPQGIGNGNIAITHPAGTFQLQNVGHYGDRGIDCAGAVVDCNDSTSNSFHNDPNSYPNTFDIGTETGDSVAASGPAGPLRAVEGTRVDPGTDFGVEGGFDFSILLAEINEAKIDLPALASTSVLDVTTKDGTIDGQDASSLSAVSISGGPSISIPPVTDPETLKIDLLTTGLHVIDIETNANDFLLQNMNLVVDGPAGSFALFRLPDDDNDGDTDQNMIISNASIFAGDGGIDLFNIMFFSNRPGTGNHFDFDNTILNGAVFWTIAMGGGGIDINDAQGCTQLVADKITLNDVRFDRCAASFVVPEPGPSPLVGLSFLALAGFGFASLRRARA